MIDNPDYIPESQKHAIDDAFNHGDLIEETNLSPPVSVTLRALEFRVRDYLSRCLDVKDSTDPMRITEVLNLPDIAQSFEAIKELIEPPVPGQEFFDATGRTQPYASEAFRQSVEEALVMRDVYKLLHTIRLGRELQIDTPKNWVLLINDLIARTPTLSQTTSEIQALKSRQIYTLLGGFSAHMERKEENSQEDTA